MRSEQTLSISMQPRPFHRTLPAIARIGLPLSLSLSLLIGYRSFSRIRSLRLARRRSALRRESLALHYALEMCFARDMRVEQALDTVARGSGQLPSTLRATLSAYPGRPLEQALHAFAVQCDTPAVDRLTRRLLARCAREQQAVASTVLAA